MWARGAVVVALLTFSGEIPTSTSFFFSPPSWTAPPTCHGYRSSTSSYPCRAVPFPRLGFAGERQHAQRRSRRPYSSSNASAEDAVQHYTNADLDSLTRSELQALCKELGVRAVGKTSELLTRLQHHRQHVQSLAEAEAFPSSSSSSSPSSPFPIGDHAPAPASVGENSRVGPNTTAVLDEILSTPDNRRSYATRNSKTRTPNTEPTTTPTTVVVSASTTPPPSTLRITPALGLSTPALGLSPPADGSGESVGASPSEFLLDEMRPAFQELSDEQWDQVEMLGQLLTEWNGRVNLISRKDIANVLPRHVMPCLAMAKALNLRDGVEVLDVGTGGGLPGLPLAIFYPKVRFTLIDGTGKKIKAVQDMALRLGLDNVQAFHVRAEEVHESFDFVMGRAVTALPKFVGFIDKNLKPNKPSSLFAGSKLAGKEDGADSDGSDGGGGDGGGNDREEGIHLKRGLLYMRGEVSEEELAELGARPSTVIPLRGDFVVGGPGGKEAAEGVEGGARDRGYSSVFHFTSEAIWNRMPVAASPSAGERDRGERARGGRGGDGERFQFS